ncbi:hypothetical protein RRG08_022307 [Elysia crispata]|uniref:Uncharacterized protein n=1 Tax=Elysia crispata TaxID=231223 RepID=A0AAE0ZQT0_9GAST|nr:hypothetical protein RRG08_022307 [Elysia crispata]
MTGPGQVERKDLNPFGITRVLSDMFGSKTVAQVTTQRQPERDDSQLASNNHQQQQKQTRQQQYMIQLQNRSSDICNNFSSSSDNKKNHLLDSPRATLIGISNGSQNSDLARKVHLHSRSPTQPRCTGENRSHLELSLDEPELFPISSVPETNRIGLPSDGSKDRPPTCCKSYDATDGARPRLGYHPYLRQSQHMEVKSESKNDKHKRPELNLKTKNDGENILTSRPIRTNWKPNHANECKDLNLADKSLRTDLAQQQIIPPVKNLQSCLNEEFDKSPPAETHSREATLFPMTNTNRGAGTPETGPETDLVDISRSSQHCAKTQATQDHQAETSWQDNWD